VQDAYSPDSGGWAEQFFLPELPEDAAKHKKTAADETCSTARYV